MSGRGRDASRGSGTALLPLLDRLIDSEPERLVDAPLSSSEAMRILTNSVRRDLEMLLNARRRFRSWPTAYSELDVSPIAYGIPDCTAGTFNDQREREMFRAEVEATIRRFEPRFLSVSVHLPDLDPRKLTSSLRLRIEALLHADPAPEAVFFDTTMDAVTSTFAIDAAGSP